MHSYFKLVLIIQVTQTHLCLMQKLPHVYHLFLIASSTSHSSLLVNLYFPQLFHAVYVLLSVFLSLRFVVLHLEDQVINLNVYLIHTLHFTVCFYPLVLILQLSNGVFQFSTLYF